MAPKQISKSLGVVDTFLQSLRDLGYISAACASVLGVLVFLGHTNRTASDKSPPPPVVKKHRWYGSGIGLATGIGSYMVCAWIDRLVLNWSRKSELIEIHHPLAALA